MFQAIQVSSNVLPFSRITSESSGSHSSTFCRAPLTTSYFVSYIQEGGKFRLTELVKLVFLPARVDSILHYLGIRMNFDPIIAQVAFHSKLPYRRGVVISNLFLLRIVAYA